MLYFPGHVAVGQIWTAVSHVGFGHLFEGLISVLITGKRKQHYFFIEKEVKQTGFGPQLSLPISRDYSLF